MRHRMTVCDAATGLRTDVVVECAPNDPTRVALDLIAGELPVTGRPVVDGVEPDPEIPFGQSVLCAGTVLHYGGHHGAGAASTPVGGSSAARPSPVQPEVRVVAGPSAGAYLRLRQGAVARVGRNPAADLPLADRDVSWTHAELRVVADGVEVVDLGSTNGVLVEGQLVRGPRLLRDGEVAQLGGSRLTVETGQSAGAVLGRADDGSHLLNRGFPDRRSPFVPPTVELPRPPPEDEHRSLPLLAMLVPMALAGILAWVLHSPLYLLFGLLTPVLLGANWWTERRRRRKRDERHDRTYAAGLRAARAKVEEAILDEDADLRLRWPDPATVARTALLRRRGLWSRRPGDADWLGVRVGIADRPAAVRVTGDRPPDWEEPLLLRAPVGLDLDELGVLGMAGPPPWMRERLAAVLTQCAVLHSPDELQIAVVAPRATDADAGWLRWLPHVRPSGTSFLAWDDATADDLLYTLQSDVELRVQAGRRSNGLPRRLVVLMGAGRLVRHPAVTVLLERGPAVGYRFVCVDAEERLLPGRCRAVLVGEPDRTELRVDLGSRVSVVPDALAPGVAEQVARALSPLRPVGAGGAGVLPDMVRFTDLVGRPDAAAVRESWRRGRGGTGVTLGRDADGPVTLDIVRDGPHALVAGTPGAGKSELLRSWIAGLALAAAPADLSLLLMDYKGGATFRDLVTLPHVVGLVTNLDARLADRAAASLHAELLRRERQLNAAGVDDVAGYRRRAAEDPGLAPFPRLLIVVDELAEMKQQLPHLVDELIKVSRLGRSLGVHLVLATQKPGGVVDGQLRASVDLRICLRVANDAESVDVVDVPDAARIDKRLPGRALVLRGGDAPAPVQTALVTTPRGDADDAVRRAVVVGWHAEPPPAVRPVAAGHGTDLDAVIEAVREAAGAAGPPFRPWLPPLPDRLPLDAVGPEPRTLLLGLRDRPAAQLQEPLRVPLGSGHVGIVGSGRTGRTAALRAVGVALALSSTPDEVNIHVVTGSGGLQGLRVLPHVGVVAGEDDSERLERLLSRLVSTVRRRRRLLDEAGASDLDELRTAHPDRAVPHIVLLVDSWAGISEGDGPAEQAAQELLGEGATAAGVTLCVAGDERLLRYRILNRLDHRLCLRLNNPSDATVLGIGARMVDGLPAGRGVWADDGSAVQVPLLVDDPAGTAQSAALAALGRELHDRYGTPEGPCAPMRLDPLPAVAGRAWTERLGPPRPEGCAALVGVSGDRLRAVWARFDAGTGPLIIAGPARSGRSTAAAGVAASTAAGGARVLLVAPRPGPAHAAAGAGGVQLVPPLDLAATLDAGAPDVVVIDDADTAGLDDALVARLTGPRAPALAVVGLLDSFGIGVRGLLQAARNRPGPVVLLSPPNHLAAGNVNVRLDRSGAFSGPPGRAWLMVDGELLLGQVPDLTVD